MIFELRLPVINPQMSGATLEYLHSTGGSLKVGSKLLDVSVDLGKAFAQECPPISYYRFVMREAVWLREIKVRPGQYSEVDDPIALFSSEPDEDLNQPIKRPVRVTVAGIMYHSDMWTAGDR